MNENILDRTIPVEDSLISEVEKIVTESEAKSEERRSTDFTPQRTPEFLLDVEKAVAMGQRDKVSELIRNMYELDGSQDLQGTFSDLLTSLDMCVKEMLESNTVWQFIRNVNLMQTAPSPKVSGVKVSKTAERIEGGSSAAILLAINKQSIDHRKAKDELYLRALESVLDDLKRRILLRVGVLTIAERLEDIAQPIELG